MDDKKSDFSDTVNLNDPILDAAGSPKTYAITALAFAGIYSTLTASGATFITDGVQPGDVVYNVSISVGGAKIVQINSETEIVVEGIAASAGQSISILKGSTETAVLYVGTNPAGTVVLKVRTSGGDDITFHNPPEGSFLPVQVKRLYNTGTTVTDVLALF